MGATIAPTHLSNPLATAEQLSSSGSVLDGVPAELEASIRFAGARLTQAAGILLELSQDIIAQAVVIFIRFWLGPEGGSFRQYDGKDVSMAALYMVSKLSADPQSPRNILNVYTFLLSPSSPLVNGTDGTSSSDPEAFYLTEGSYLAQRNRLMKTEAHVLRILGFQTHVALPYTLAVNYLQALDVFAKPGASEVAQRTFASLTTALLSPQLLYLTHQPPALATAAIYLAARDVGVKLPMEDWWEVFDVDREELGFLVVGMRSTVDFAVAEKEKWGKRKEPMTVEAVEAELDNYRLLNGQR
ncbi:MAG: hypothetical protein M1832_001404 [Thelocarpon impressellum]|nr:MAG: hypothetical protein M1832_001404 [Thelocarpon impressellum]